MVVALLTDTSLLWTVRLRPELRASPYYGHSTHTLRCLYQKGSSILGFHQYTPNCNIVVIQK